MPKPHARAYLVEQMRAAKAELVDACKHRRERDAHNALTEIARLRLRFQQLDDYMVACLFADDPDEIHVPGEAGGWAKDLDLSRELPGGAPAPTICANSANVAELTL